MSNEAISLRWFPPPTQQTESTFTHFLPTILSGTWQIKKKYGIQKRNALIKGNKYSALDGS